MARPTAEICAPPALQRSKAFTSTPAWKLLRTPEQAVQAWEQATRQCWRALALIMKVKLEAVESGSCTWSVRINEMGLSGAVNLA